MPQEMPVQERFEMDGDGVPREMQVNEELAHEIGEAPTTEHRRAP